MTRTHTATDRYGLPLSTSTPAAMTRYIDGVDRLLALNAGAEEQLADAVTADDGFALGHAALAFLFQQQSRTDEAKAHAARARALAAGVTPREQGHIAAIATAVEGDGTAALALVREHLAEYPRDALLLQQATNLISFGGAADRQQQRFAMLEQHAPAYGDDWWFLSAFSFAHHELDQFEEARRLSRRSLDLYPRNASAAHNIVHVDYETNDHAGGARFLDGWLTDYDRAAPFHCHLSWHLALFDLAQGRYSGVLERYERDISPAVTQTRAALFDGASLLWRWQLFGCDARPLPWDEVCAFASRLAAQPGLAFLDAHAALAYAAAGDEAAMGRLVDGLRALDARGHPIAGRVVLPLALGVAAFARGEWEEAIRHLAPIQPEMGRIGGSHAQWEVFEDTLIEAYLRAQRYEDAIALLRRRLDRRSSARDLFWLGRAQTGLGAAGAGGASLRAARGQWAAAEASAPEQVALNRMLVGAPVSR